MINVPEYRNAERVFYFFEQISKIPHTSTNTAKIAEYLVGFAKERGLWYAKDEANNVVIRKPATNGYEGRNTIIFQAHTDMVEDKLKDCKIDMKTEPIEIYRDGDFIKAKGTTLGGDDGIGVAYALAILDSTDIPHPEFEAVFTSDEEIGLIGAGALDTSILHGSCMINVDSDVEGVFTVGCAGGMRMDITLPYEKNEETRNLRKITVSGLLGGHSGTEIDKPRCNAIKALAEILSESKSARLATASGGNADNAIPRYAECTVSIEDADYVKSTVIPSVIQKYIGIEPNIKITVEDANSNALCYSKENTDKILEVILKMPSGVYKMSEALKDLPETSSNLGILAEDGGRVKLSVSLRSSKNSEKCKLRDIVRSLCKEFNAEVFEHGEYPAWEYRDASHLCDTMKKVYLDMYKKEPLVVTIHAGLECGIFAEKIKDFDCVSIGPDNFDIHTTDERLSISSTARVYDFLKNILKQI